MCFTVNNVMPVVLQCFVYLIVNICATKIKQITETAQRIWRITVSVATTVVLQRWQVWWESTDGHHYVTLLVTLHFLASATSLLCVRGDARILEITIHTFIFRLPLWCITERRAAAAARRSVSTEWRHAWLHRIRSRRAVERESR